MKRLGGAFIAAQCIAAAFAQAAAAAPLPPDDPWKELPVATLADKPATALQLGRVKVWLEFNTLAEVMRVAGPNTIAHYEDDDSSYDWICYDLAGHRQRLWFVSDSDMGGARQMVTSIAAAMLDGASDDSCPLLPKNIGRVALDHAVWLGSGDADLEKQLGEPSGLLRDWRSYYSNHRVLMPRKTPNEAGAMDDDVDESSYLNLRLVDGRVVQLVAGKLTSD